ncbi:TPA: DUF4336 domain-containing protein [Photobacterium damselae]
MIEWMKDRIWYQDGQFSQLGIAVGSRMTIIKLADEKLFIHSPIQLTTQLQLELSKLGHVAMVVTPNLNHHLFLSEWWLAYPSAYFYAPPGLQQKRSDLVFDGTLNTKTEPLWHGQLLQTVLKGSDTMEEVIFCDPLSRTLIIGDSLVWLKNRTSPISIILGLINGCYFNPAMPYYWRLSFHNKTRMRQSLQEILTWLLTELFFHMDKLLKQMEKLSLRKLFIGS